MEQVTIYTDGSASNIVPLPDRVGGYASVILLGDIEKIISGSDKPLTSQQAELMAVISALYIVYSEELAKDKDVVVISDSAYIVNCFLDKWWEMWKINGFTTVKNREYWEVLLELVFDRGMNVRFKKVKGHSGDNYNEMADKAAKEARLNHA